jgi:RNA polymerase sigma factor (sigma-70 family)
LDPQVAIFDDRKWLWNVIYARLGDTSATEDILQDVYVAVLQKRQSWQDIQQIRGWLYQVAIRHVLQFRRRQMRQRARIQRYVQIKLADGETSVLDRLCGDEQIDIVRTARWQLRPSDRQVLLLKYREDLSCHDISIHLGVSETTVQTRLLRARRRLKGLLVNNQESQEVPK